MKKISRFLFGLLACCALMLGAASASLAAYPDHTVRIIVGFAPGGGTDLIARVLAAKLSEKWGQPVIVENRAGADGTIGAEYVSHSPPDGYALLLPTISQTVTPSQYKLTFDPIKGFAPVIQIDSSPTFIISTTASGIVSIPDLIAKAKAAPGKLNYGSSGVGSPGVLAAGLLEKMAGIKLTNISYKGAGAILPALLGNEVPMTFGSLAGAVEGQTAGKLKIIGITSKTRYPSLPDVPTVAEAAHLPDYEANNWHGILASPGTPPDIVLKINRDVAEIKKTKEFQEVLGEQALIVVPDNTPEEFTKFMYADLARWTDVMKSFENK